MEIVSDDELVAVVPHELGHLYLKHNARMLVRQIWLSEVLGTPICANSIENLSLGDSYQIAEMHGHPLQ